MTTITDNDKYVLNAMFNPNYPLDFDQKSPSDVLDTENDRKTRVSFENYHFMNIFQKKCWKLNKLRRKVGFKEL